MSYRESIVRPNLTCYRAKGEQVYKASLEKIVRAVETKGNILPKVKKAWENFSNLPSRPDSRPVVGVIGEIYVRSNPAANNNLISVLERLGMEVWTPFMGEWLHYVNFTSRRSAWRDRQWKMLLKLLIEHLIQKKDEERFFSLLAGLQIGRAHV